ncbi:hypothetical protein EGW08_008364, partial [Elysia chlorotica]
MRPCRIRWRSRYFDLFLFAAIAVVSSIVMQLSIYSIGAWSCEMIGLQASNTFCQLYFSVDADDPMKAGNISRTKRWCLLYRDIPNSGQGIRCTRSKVFWNHNKDHHLARANAQKGKMTTTLAPTDTHKTEVRTNEVEEELNLDQLRQLLPLIELKPKALKPKIWIHRETRPVELVMTLSIYKFLDSEDTQLFTTLDTLFFSIAPSDQHKCLVMVFITEILDDRYTEKLISKMIQRYSIQVDTGLMEIVAPRDNFYISMFKPKSAQGKNNMSDEKKKRSRFRRKQCMDHIYMMLMAKNRGQYYLQLSHDVITVQNFLTNIYQTLDRHVSRNWVLMRFSSVGIIGKLVHASDLLDIAKYLSRLYMNKPADFHVAMFAKNQQCPPKKDQTSKSIECKNHRSSVRAQSTLFRYMGEDISIHGKGQNDTGKQREAPVESESSSSRWKTSSLKFLNVKEQIPCTTVQITHDILPILANGAVLVKFTGKSQHERIDICFTPPL